MPQELTDEPPDASTAVGATLLVQLRPSVLSEDVFTTDERTYHEALPVVSGLKYAANFWIHLHDFQNYHARGCDNRDYLQDDTLARTDRSHLM